MRIVHISDTHLGYQAYRAIDKETGLNQRETDVNRAFAQAIDKIIEIKPDVVLHTGDLFDSVRPSNRTLHFALEQLLRLCEKEIPVVIISGNHSLPRMRDTGSVFQLFALPAFSHLYPIFKSRYEVIRLKELVIHAIPQCLTKDDLNEQLKKIKLDPKAKYNVLLLHAAIAGIPEFSMGDFNEQEVPESYLKKDFDYIGLGHYHKYTQVQENAYYAGSTERFSFNEIGQEKGFLEINLKNQQVIFHPLEIRPMIDLPPIDAQHLDVEALMRKIEKTLQENDINKKILRLTVNNLAPATHNALDFNHLRQLVKSALHCEFRFNRRERADAVASPLSSIGKLSSEFRDYLSQIPIEKGKEEILKLGLKYLQRAGEE